MTNSPTSSATSLCCGAPVISAHGEDFGKDDEIATCWNECTKCKKPCSLSHGTLPPFDAHSSLGVTAPEPSAVHQKPSQEIQAKVSELIKDKTEGRDYHLGNAPYWIEAILDFLDSHFPHG